MRAKVQYQVMLEKNQEKGGAWLAHVKVVGGADDIPTRYSAWGSLAPAKRWAASVLNRGRLPWVASDDNKIFSCVVEVKL